MRFKTLCFTLFCLIIRLGNTTDIKQIHLHRSTGELLFKVGLQYTNGTLTSRTVYDFDDYVLWHLNLSYQGEKLEKHLYLDPTGEIDKSSIYTNRGEVKSLSVMDRFDEILFQAEYNTTSSNNEFQLSNGTKFVYHYDSRGVIDRINIYNQANEITHYVKAFSGTSSLKQDEKISIPQMIRKIDRLNSNIIQFEIEFEKKSDINISAYNFQGKLLGENFKSNLSKGLHKIQVNLNDLNVLNKQSNKSKNGFVILIISLNKNAPIFKIKVRV